MINTILIFMAIAIIMIIGFNQRKKSKDVDNEENEKDEFIDYNQEFIESSEGQEVIPFVRLFSQSDKLMIRSLLSSENISTYITNENTNNLFPGRMVQGYTDTVIYIFKEDRERARSIIEDYILNLIENIYPEIKTKAIDLVAAMALLPTSMNQIVPEIIDWYLVSVERKEKELWPGCVDVV